ncbi:MAG: ABC transporter permease subunit [Candidatus Paceibacterota bacterium]|jgi:NitT/TauT family transport system permease protein
MDNNIHCRTPLFFGINAKPGEKLSKLLGLLPVALLLLVYFLIAQKRHEKNPDDKLMPYFSQMYGEMKEIITVPDKRSGKNFFLEDTKASLRRLAIGVGISAVFGYVAGIMIGLFPGLRSLFMPIITVLSNINPLAVLVIVLVALGIGEASKIFLIVFGIGIPIARSVEQMVEQIPNEVKVKQLTLGASQFEVLMRIVVPQMFPRLIDLVRVSLGAAWIFVIASEAVASTEGLGYRVYLQQRYMNMALIIPYVMYITALAYSCDYILKLSLKLRCFAWYSKVSN